MIKNTLKILLGIFGLLFIVYFSGPKVGDPNLDQNLPDVPQDLLELNAWIDSHEATIADLKPGNQSRIEFYD